MCLRVFCFLFFFFFESWTAIWRADVKKPDSNIKKDCDHLVTAVWPMYPSSWKLYVAKDMTAFGILAGNE